MLLFRTFLLSVIMVYLCQCNTVEASQYIVTTHAVQLGESLDSVARLYITPDRRIAEFKEGIVENNYENTFHCRPSDVVYPGDILIITYWVN